MTDDWFTEQTKAKPKLDWFEQQEMAAVLPSPEDAAKQAGSAPGRFLSGIGKQVVGAVKSIPEMGKVALQSAIGNQQPAIDMFIKPQVAEWQKSELPNQPGENPLLGVATRTGHKIAAMVPMVGPAVAQVGEAIAKDPAEGLGQAAGMLGMLGAGKLAKIGGAKFGDVGEPLPQTMPGLETTALESSPGFMAGIARGAATSPAGQKPVAAFLEKRNAATNAAADELLNRAGPQGADIPMDTVKANAQQEAAQLAQRANEENALLVAARDRRHAEAVRAQTAEYERAKAAAKEEQARQTAAMEQLGVSKATGEVQRTRGIPGEAGGKVINQAVSQRAADIKGIESSQWEGLKRKVEERGVTATMDRTMERGQPVYELSHKAFEVLTPNVSPSTARLLAKVAGKNDPLSLQSGNMDMGVRQLLESLPPESRQAVMAQIGGEAEQIPWSALHEARSEVGALLRKAQIRDALGSRDAGALKQLYAGMTEDLRSALPEDLRPDFDRAVNVTKAKREIFGTKGATTTSLLKPDTTLMPSEIVSKLVGGTPENARLFRRSIGPDAEAQQALKAGVTEELFSRARSTQGEAATGKIDYRKALKELDSNPVYREVLERDDFKSLRSRVLTEAERPAPALNKPEKPEKPIKAEVPPTRISVSRSEGPADISIEAESGKAPTVKVEETKRRSLENLFSKSKNAAGQFNGQKFSNNYKSARESLKAQGFDEAHLSDLDDLAEQVKTHTLTQRSGKLASLADKGAVVAGVGALASGHPLAAAGTAAYLLGERALVKIMLTPEGPNLLARALKTPSWAPEAGEISGRLMQIGGVTPKQGSQANPK